MNSIKTLLIVLLVSFLIIPSNAQKDKEEKSEMEKVSLSGLKFRCVGPAIASGRIADIAVNPKNPFEYYVAVASGGVWKTVNAGTTYTPIFDSQASYSIGCVTIDPSNHNTIWVGSGENNNQRSVAYGDGVYKSEDRGKSWKNMGLKSSEHIGKIIVDPSNSDIVYVAAMGPLWSEGGERGVYKTVDGGENWKLVLEIDKHTGVSDLIMDPRNPSVLYAAAQQRRRHVFTYVGGGPGSGMHKSIDGGETWTKINSGLPANMGRIGLAISPADNDYIYAVVEAAEGKGGTFRTTDGGITWKKRGSYTSSGNYYQEIYCDLTDRNKLYAMNTWMQKSTDGGKTFQNVGEDTKHVDNHCMWIDPMNGDHWLVGCDGGLYETFDAAKTWDFKPNLPVTQFYKVAVDNDAPFYNIYGGTQDNSSMGGPSRTITSHGITNSDWFFTHGGDGFESQVDPKNPNIVYAQSQYGVLVRFDKLSGEEVGIQPKERKNENAYRWNWDAPLAVSPHKDGRLYFAANKVFRSDDYGNSWEVISEDLTRQIDRNTLKVMGRVQSMDAVMKNSSTSPYGTIVAFSESTLDPNFLVIGTDDGLIQITNDGGTTWTKVERFSGVPENTYVNSVYCSQHDASVIYAAFNNHKKGDFKPYIYKSSDKGKTWKSISNNLPERGSVYAIEEDHVDPNLIFTGTEFGVFFSNDSGMNWKQLKAGVPTIAVRDLAIQKRENDLVLGTFGRGFYVLDDYSALRSINNESLEGEAMLFSVRDPLAFEQSTPLGLPGKAMSGDSYYSAEDLGPVAMITYYVKEKVKTLKDSRKKREKEAIKENEDTPFLSYEELKSEREQLKPQLLFTITDESGNVVRKLMKGYSAGVQRMTWDLRYAPKDPINLRKPAFYNPWAGKAEGSLVQPGKYMIQMTKYVDGVFTDLGSPQEFEVKLLNERVMPAQDPIAKTKFQREVDELNRSISGAGRLIGEMRNKVRHMKEAIKMVELPMPELMNEIVTIENEIRAASVLLNGDPIKGKLDIGAPPTPAGRLGWIVYEQKHSTSDPTETHKNSLAIAKEEFVPIMDTLTAIATVMIPQLEEKLEGADAPYTPGRAIKMMRGH
ncbi:MAG: glycosyl hydrolase [Saprospiraceae bacterium]|nr:glycosyl hydrolase [Saprospiraceae bacterium]